MRCCHEKVLSQKQTESIEVADILRWHLSDFLKKYKLHPSHYKVINDILNCRTAYLGGRVERCNRCGYEKLLYNSCRNRHCPKCQVMTKEKWLEARKADLLPIPYFHGVFTLPHILNPLILVNKKVLLTLLFQASSETLITFSGNGIGGLSGTLGFHMLLHTWDQKMNAHFHTHCLIPGGVFNGEEFVCFSKHFFYNVRQLSITFKAIFLKKLRKAFREKELIFHGKAKSFGTKKRFRHLCNQLFQKRWVVYAKESMNRPEDVLDYLGRYTHRIAISNHRIVSVENGKVTFTWKERKTKEKRYETIDAVEFIRRFLLHTLPRGFCRIRHYGFLGNSVKKEQIAIIRERMDYRHFSLIEKTIVQLMLERAGRNIDQCPSCLKGRMETIDEIEEVQYENELNRILQKHYFDTS